MVLENASVWIGDGTGPKKLIKGASDYISSEQAKEVALKSLSEVERTSPESLFDSMMKGPLFLYLLDGSNRSRVISSSRLTLRIGPWVDRSYSGPRT